MKVSQIHYVIFQPTSQFSFKFSITFQCQDTSFWNLLAETLHAFEKKSSSKSKFPDFRLLEWILTKLLQSFLELQVSLPLNFASRFNIITYKSSEIFQLNNYILWAKGAHQWTVFQTLSAVVKVHPIPHMVFETTWSGFIPWKITPLCFFSSKIIDFGQK